MDSGIAIVTGAGRGLGRATATELARRGYRVVVTARDLSDAHSVADEIATLGGDAIPQRLDVADSDAIREAVEELVENISSRWGATTVDLLVNNAGVGLFSPLEHVTVDDFDLTFAVNVRGPVLVTQALAPHLSSGARIVNISSSLSRHVSPATSVYAASKAALEAWSRSVAVELGPRGIRVNTLAPGPTATDFNGGAMRDNVEMRRHLGEQTALGRVSEPGEIADAVAALASDDLRWVTGERIEVSGGVLL